MEVIKYIKAKKWQNLNETTIYSSTLQQTWAHFLQRDLEYN